MASRFFIALSLMLLGPAVFGRSRVPARLLDPTVSDEYLVKLGTAAVPFLCARLEKASEEPYYRGIVVRLEEAAIPIEQRPKVTQSLIRFVDVNIRRKADVGNTVSAVCGALVTVGRVGGDAGIDYLVDWLKNPKKAKAVKFYRGVSKNPEESKANLFACVANGLGESGSPRALQALKDALKSPPKTIWPQKLMSVLNEVVQNLENHSGMPPQPDPRGTPQ